MTIFKCKMCGGDLDAQEGVTVVECEYCGTKQTVPTADNEKKVNLFNRANRLRINCEFDKAASVYESIVAEFPEEAEAYWGLCLCKFGIEYVDDLATAKKIPTCHRTSYDSIFDDNNFDLACEYADAVARNLYRDEAKEIDRLQKAILKIAQNEEPFDVFICYKESDEYGSRTVDSELAHDIYDVLTEKGYKVFYSRITLKAKLGQDYEPYIFSALNSAKVMLAIGTKYDYFNAIWVKNEWSRFLVLMGKDSTKTLIPCYRDIDAYDMPKEFGKLQGQDLSSPRAFQDLVTNIERIIPRKDIASQSIVTISADPSVEPLLKRAYICLEGEEWNKADELCEQVLNRDPENAQAYLCKFCTENHLINPEKIAYLDNIDENDKNLKNVIRFGDNAINEKINLYFSGIKDRRTSLLLKQAIAFWDDEKYIQADEFFEKALKSDPECGMAYYGKWLLEFIKSVRIHNHTLDITDPNIFRFIGLGDLSGMKESQYYKKAKHFADNKLSEVLGSMDKLDSLINNTKTIELPKGIKEIPDFAYDAYGGLTSVLIPDSVTSIGKYAFSSCLCLQNITIPDSVTTIGDCAFLWCASLKSITLSNSITSIGRYVFNACICLTDITIPDAVTSIEDGTFFCCSGLKRITIPNSVTSIGDYAFNGCSGLTHITIPDSVTSIGDNVFEGCTCLTDITIPDSVVSIGKNLFKRCKNLTVVVSSLIKDLKFSSSDIKILLVPKMLYNNYLELGFSCEVKAYLTKEEQEQEERLRQQRRIKKEQEEKLQQQRRAKQEQEQQMQQLLQEEMARQQQRRTQNVCQYCGGAFKGLFSKKCSICGMWKDY